MAELSHILLIFGAALVVALLVRVVRAPSIIGFLGAGVLIGPSGLGLLGPQQVHVYAELGLVLLLFTVGLELSFEPLRRVGGLLILATAAQIVVTVLPVGAVLVARGLSASAAAIIGVAAALSSTAIVFKQLSDRGEIDTPQGVLTGGILLLQDVFVIVLLILLPVLGIGAEGAWETALARIGVSLSVLVVATLLARPLVPGLARLVSQRGAADLLTLFAIVTACAGAWLATRANWSPGLGACIAGLLLSQTELRHQLRAEITPFRDAFNALFFMSIGMLVDLQAISGMLAPLSVAVLATLLVKTLTTAGAVRACGWPARIALSAGLGLCTVSEFSYVLAYEATRLGLLPGEYTSPIVAWTVGTMLVGALLLPVAEPIGYRVDALLSHRARTSAQPSAVGAPESAGSRIPASGHVIIVGYGVNGRNLASVLRATRIPYVVIEANPLIARRAREDAGTEERAWVIHGDATRLAILQVARLDQARALVVAIADLHAARLIVAQARRARPDLYILARTRYVTELDELYRLGAQRVIPEEFETSIEIFAHVLKEFGIPDNVIDQQVTIIRAGRYGMLRGRISDRTLRTEWTRLLEAAVTQTYLVQDDSPAAGRTIRQLRLRSRTGVTVVALTRAGRPIPNPSPDLPIQPGDVLVLVGSHQQLESARRLLDGPSPLPPERNV